MTTYIFAEKNGSATMTLSADTEKEAIQYLRNVTKNPSGWRLDSEEDD